MTAHHHACCGCEGKDPCCTGQAARLPDDAGAATATLSIGYTCTTRVRYIHLDGSTLADDTGDLSVNATVTFGITGTPWGGTCISQASAGGEGVGSITSASATASTPGGSTGLFADILESRLTLRAVPAFADPTKYSIIATGWITVSLAVGSEPWVWSSVDTVSLSVYYRPSDGKSYTVVGLTPDAFEVPTNPAGGSPLATDLLCYSNERICDAEAVFPEPDGLSASASGTFERSCSTNAGTATTFTVDRTGSASASLALDGIGWTPCPEVELPDAEAADCNDLDVVECRDVNGNPRDERCCDPVNPLPPDDPRCAVISGAACCPTDSGIFLADNAYAVLILDWSYRQVAFATSPNRWIPLQVWVGSAALRIELPRAGSPQCVFRTSGAALTGGPNQSSLTGEAPISVRYINMGSEGSPNWQAATRFFSSQFTVGETTSANLLLRIHNTTGSGSDLNVNIVASASSTPPCTPTRGSMTRQTTGWTLACSRGEWPASGSGFWTQFTLRDNRPGLPTDGSVGGTQWDGEVNAALRIYGMGVCAGSMLTVGASSMLGLDSLLASHADARARTLASLQGQPALQRAVSRALSAKAPKATIKKRPRTKGDCCADERARE